VRHTKGYHHINLSILLLTLVYVFICLSHLFLIPGHNHAGGHKVNSVFKRKTEEQNFVRRTDKILSSAQGKEISKLIRLGSKMFTLLIYHASNIPNTARSTELYNKPPRISYDLFAYHCVFKI